jgi:hypothetical protein
MAAVLSIEPMQPIPADGPWRKWGCITFPLLIRYPVKKMGAGYKEGK